MIIVQNTFSINTSRESWLGMRKRREGKMIPTNLNKCNASGTNSRGTGECTVLSLASFYLLLTSKYFDANIETICGCDIAKETRRSLGKWQGLATIAGQHATQAQCGWLRELSSGVNWRQLLTLCTPVVNTWTHASGTRGRVCVYNALQSQTTDAAYTVTQPVALKLGTNLWWKNKATDLSLGSS